MPTAYCFKCWQKREIKDPEQVTLKNGRPAVRVNVKRKCTHYDG